MRLRHLVIQLSTAASVLAAANVGVSLLARNSVPRQVLRLGEQASPATELFLGDSTMAAGLDTAAFAAVKAGQPLNLSLGSSSSVEQYLIYRRQSKHHKAAVYLGFFDTHITDNPIGGWKELVGNRALAYYVDPEIAITLYADSSPLLAFRHHLVAQVPLLVERLAIWSKVEILRRSFGELGLPKKETNRFGRAEDFALLEADPVEFVERCESAVAEDLPLSKAVTAMFRDVKQRGNPLYVVEMPMPSAHRDRFYSGAAWKRYREHVISLVTEAGGEYVPAADWIQDDGFADHLHLNASGARVFSGQLARWNGQQR